MIARRRASGCSRTAVLALALLAPLASAAAAHAATDTFTRAVTGAWGVADDGGTWRVEGTASAFSVADGTGRLLLAAPRANLAAMLPGAVTDADVAATLSLDRAPAGAAAWVYLEVRRVGATSYRLRARLLPGGGVAVGASRVVNGAETSLRADVTVPALDSRTGFRIRGQVTGVNPTTLRVRAWVGSEPTGWTATATDATAALQRAGESGVRAYLSAGTTNAPVTVRVDDYAANATAPPPPPPTDPVLVGAGDIASDGPGDEATARLLDAIPGSVFTLGDNVYPDGTAAEFSAYYAPTWGRHKSRTIPVLGNHEYNTGNANGHFGYFGAAAGDPAKGYFSVDRGSWHVIVLNSNCSFVSCSATSAQVQWLRADLAANTRTCVAALFHHPRFSSAAGNANTTSVAPFWDALYQYRADVVLSGHAHVYERFARKSPSGAVDSARGIREFVVGTGGVGSGSFASTPQPGSQVRNGTTRGVLKLTLRPTGYDWQFVPVAGSSFTDSGSDRCVV